MKRMNWITAALAPLTLLPVVLAGGGCFYDRHDDHDDRDRATEQRDLHDNDHHDADHHDAGPHDDDHGAEIIIK